ncbi:Nucleotide-binding, alpha-beta plait [Corchorus olitorius]|uniref:Nucleotide-binding, alpha-beta plait n=1 Tax=Corchorus olitorius TaxID=93759 RepID=A0A1R3GR61_9ROSI|nr:Nucleotide-binding, alpha-beta plait [Corchorus olitorius]
MAVQGRWRDHVLKREERRFLSQSQSQRRSSRWFVEWRSKLHAVVDVYIHHAIRKWNVTFAFVRYWRESEAMVAIEKGDSRLLEGIRVSVSKANMTNNKRRGGDRQIVDPTCGFISKPAGDLKGASLDGRTYKASVLGTKKMKTDFSKPTEG